MNEKSVVKVIEDSSRHILNQGKSELTAKNYKQSLRMFNSCLQANNGDLAILTIFDVQLFVQNLESKGIVPVPLTIDLPQFPSFLST